jgi:type IV pilus assembly protein PilP
MIRIVLILFLIILQNVKAQNAEGTSEPPVQPMTESADTVVELENTQQELVPQVDYIYDPTGKKDPFKPYRAPRVRGDNRPSAPIDPLSIVDVSQIKLVAVMWNTAKPRAVVKDGAGRSYVLFKNMRIGRNEGVVVDIREGEIVVVEKFDDGFGNTVREAKVIGINPIDSNSAAGE